MYAVLRNVLIRSVSTKVLNTRLSIKLKNTTLSEQNLHTFPVLCLSSKGEGSSDSVMDKEDLKQRLTPLQYHVTQEAGTERPFTGCYNKVYDEGMYKCIVCKQDLFSSKTKYDSGCGWPAFYDVLKSDKVTLHKDTSSGLVRTEVRCASCSAHLGHVFDDGPAPTRKRFCINSASLDFIPAEQRTS